MTSELRKPNARIPPKDELWLEYLREAIPDDATFVAQLADEKTSVADLEDKMIDFVVRVDTVEPVRSRVQLRIELDELVQQSAHLHRRKPTNPLWSAHKILWLLLSETWRNNFLDPAQNKKYGRKARAPRKKSNPPKPAEPEPDDEKGADPDPMDVDPADENDEEMPDADRPLTYAERMFQLCQTIDAEYEHIFARGDDFSKTHGALHVLSKAPSCGALKFIMDHSVQLRTHMTEAAWRLLYMRWKGTRQRNDLELDVVNIPVSVHAFVTIFETYYSHKVSTLLQFGPLSILAIVNKTMLTWRAGKEIEDKKHRKALRRAFTFVIRTGDYDEPLVCFDLSMHPDDTDQRHVADGEELNKHVKMLNVRVNPTYQQDMDELFERALFAPSTFLSLRQQSPKTLQPEHFGSWLRYYPVLLFVTILHQFDRKASLSITSPIFKRDDLDHDLIKQDRRKWIDASMANDFVFRAVPK